MSGSALWGVQSAIYGKLAADAALLALATGGVHDAPPENQAYPYVVLGDAADAQADTFGRSGKTVVAQIDVYSHYKGSKEAAAIMDRIAVLLDRVPLTISGYSWVGTRHLGDSVSRVQDGAVIARLGRVTVEVKAQQV